MASALRADAPVLNVATASTATVQTETLAPPPGAAQASHVRQAADAPIPHATATVAAPPPVPLRLPEAVRQVAVRPSVLMIDCGGFSRPEYAAILRAKLAGLGAITTTSYDAPRERAYMVRIGPLSNVGCRRCDACPRLAGGCHGCADHRRITLSKPEAKMLTRRILLLAGAAMSGPIAAIAAPPPPPRRSPRPSRRRGRQTGRRCAAAVEDPAQTPIGPVDTAARWAVIIDYNTGATLLDKDADEPMPPSSMTKLMTAYIVYGMLKVGAAQARPGTAGQRAGLAHGRVEDVRAARHDR